MKRYKIMEYFEFTKSDSDIIQFLYDLNDSELNGFVNELIKSRDIKEKTELVEDILLIIGDIVSDTEYYSVHKYLNDEFLKK